MQEQLFIVGVVVATELLYLPSSRDGCQWTGGCGPTHQERAALRGGPLCSLDRGLTAVECR